MPKIKIMQSVSSNENLILGTLFLPKGLFVKVEDQDIDATEPIEAQRNNYRLQVLAVHELLDELGIPSAEGITCSEPGCNSGLEHRVRTLIQQYREQKETLVTARQLAATEVKGKLIELLNGAGRKH
jgi:hypothetical protein